MADDSMSLLETLRKVSADGEASIRPTWLDGLGAPQRLADRPDESLSRMSH
jgi:hypothetical protein